MRANRAFKAVREVLDGAGNINLSIATAAAPAVVIFTDGDSLNLDKVTQELALPFHRTVRHL